MTATPSRLDAAVQAARAGGEVLLEAFGAGRPELEVEPKAAHDFVTSADRASERAVLKVLAGNCPRDQVLSEEEGLVGSSAEYQWIVDPLDGTTNFLRGLPVWGVSVACRRGSELCVGVVLDPLNGQLYTAERGAGAECDGRRIHVSNRDSLAGSYLATGFPFKARESLDVYLEVFRRVFLQAGAIRRCGAAVLDLARTASGVFDGFFEFRLSPWDLAAGALLIEEAGGEVSDLDGGDRYLETGNFLAGSPAIHRALLREITALEGESGLDASVPRTTPPAGVTC